MCQHDSSAPDGTYTPYLLIFFASFPQTAQYHGVSEQIDIAGSTGME
jgi:hypothetical protein